MADNEENLSITEVQKDSTMKVTEPKTPFILHNAEADELMNVDGIAIMKLLSGDELEEDFTLDNTGNESDRSNSSDSAKNRRRVSVSVDDWESEEEDGDEEDKDSVVVPPVPSIPRKYVDDTSDVEMND